MPIWLSLDVFHSSPFIHCNDMILKQWFIFIIIVFPLILIILLGLEVLRRHPSFIDFASLFLRIQVLIYSFALILARFFLAGAFENLNFSTRKIKPNVIRILVVMLSFLWLLPCVEQIRTQPLDF